VSDEPLKILVNDGVKMSRGKYAAQAVHAALMAFGVHHGGPVIVLGGSVSEVSECEIQVHDAGRTEVEPGTLTAGVLAVPGVPQEGGDEVLNSRPPAEAARYVLDHMVDMVEPIQVIALRHVVERLLAEVATVDGAPERPAWTWRAIERLQERMLAAEAERDALRVQLMQSERVVEAARTCNEVIDAIRRMMATHVRDWAEDRGDAFLWQVFLGWDDADDASAMDEVAKRHGWGEAQVARLRRFHAAVDALDGKETKP
jgi:peptidyl-tRNA hydrolase, PTH2 family